MTPTRVHGPAAAVLLLVLGAAVGEAARSPKAFGAGALRRDGVIVPFAAFDGKKWVASWPLPDAEVHVPISVRDVPERWWGPTPPLDAWQAWIAGQARALRIEQPDWVDVHCVRQIGLRSDYRGASPPPSTEQPYPKDGLAVSPPQPVERIELVKAESAEMRALIPAVHQAFNTAERGLEKYHPLSRREREGRVPDIEAVYASGDSPRVYYVESVRRYRRLGQPADECAAVGFANSWFARDAAGLRSLLTVVDLLRCDRAGASYMLPLGALTAGGKPYWLVQFSGWGHERYAVVEIKRKTIAAVLNIWGGSC